MNQGLSSYLVAFGIAIFLHASLIFAIRPERLAVAVGGVNGRDTTVEVALVEAARSPDVVASPLQPATAPELREREPAPDPRPPELDPPVPAPTDADPLPQQSEPERSPAPKQPIRREKRDSQRASASLQDPARGTKRIGVAARAAGVPGAHNVSRTNLRPRYNPRPQYPAAARSRGQHGTVVIAVDVSAEGLPTRVAIKRSSGYPLLDNAALDAVRRWRFDPSRISGIAIAGRAECPIRFNLND